MCISSVWSRKNGVKALHDVSLSGTYDGVVYKKVVNEMLLSLAQSS